MSEPTKEERDALEAFRDVRISLREFRRRLRRRVSFDFTPSPEYLRRVEKHCDPAVPGVEIGLEHIRHAYAEFKAGRIDIDALSDWAAMLVLNDDYDFRESEEDLIAEWLNEACAEKSRVTNPEPQ